MTDPVQQIKDALEAMCRSASMHDTEWTHHIGGTNEWGTQCWEIDGERVQELATAYGETTSSYIAACNPVAIRTLLARLEAAEKDADRLDWLETQRMAYGFQDIHEGNEWKVDGPFVSVRNAIDAAKEQK